MRLVPAPASSFVIVGTFLAYVFSSLELLVIDSREQWSWGLGKVDLGKRARIRIDVSEDCAMK